MAQMISKTKKIIQMKRKKKKRKMMKIKKTHFQFQLGSHQ